MEAVGNCWQHVLPDYCGWAKSFSHHFTLLGIYVGKSKHSRDSARVVRNGFRNHPQYGLFGWPVCAGLLRHLGVSLPLRLGPEIMKLPGADPSGWVEKPDLVNM